MKRLTINNLHRNSIAMEINKIMHLFPALQIPEYECLDYYVRLSLWELFSNIIQHEEQAVSEEVTLEVEETVDKLRITICTSGSGFDWEHYMNQSVPDTTKVSGRGLFLVRQVTETFYYEHRGKTATLVFNKEKGTF